MLRSGTIRSRCRWSISILTDHATDQSGVIIDLAALKMNPKLYTDPRDFIIKYMNDYEYGKELSVKGRLLLEPKVITPDIRKTRLTDFMKALGQEHPAAADDNLRSTRRRMNRRVSRQWESIPIQTSGVIQSPMLTAAFITCHTR